MSAAPMPVSPALPRRGRPRRAPGGPEPVTLRQLRGLVRLVRDGTDGSVEAVVALLEQERDSLAGLLGWAPDEVPRPGELGAAETFVRRFLTWDESRRESRGKERLVEAEVLAARVVEESVLAPDGIEVGGEALRALVALGGFDVVGFRSRGEVHGFGRTLLSAILSELRGVGIETLRFEPEGGRLVVGYRAKKSRGCFRLVAERPDVRRLVVVVDLDALVRPTSELGHVYSPPNTATESEVPAPFGALVAGVSP